MVDNLNSILFSVLLVLWWGRVMVGIACAVVGSGDG